MPAPQRGWPTRTIVAGAFREALGADPVSRRTAGEIRSLLEAAGQEADVRRDALTLKGVRLKGTLLRRERSPMTDITRTASFPPNIGKGTQAATHGVLLPERRRQLQPALSLSARHAPSDRDDQRSARLMCRLSPVRLWPGLGRRLPRSAREFRQPNLGLPRKAVARAQRATQ